MTSSLSSLPVRPWQRAGIVAVCATLLGIATAPRATAQSSQDGGVFSALSSGSSQPAGSPSGSSGSDEPLVTRDRPAPQAAAVRLGDEVLRQPTEDEARAIELNPGVEYAEAFSPAMNMEVNMLIARPQDPALRENAPTIYLLNGLIGGTGWFEFTDAAAFYTSRGINVVMVTSGAFSYYTNWIQGNDQWDTFLGAELPLGIEPRLGANGKRAIMGVPMSATSVLSLVQNNPGTYDGVASISGCASTTSPLGKLAADRVFDSAHIPLTFEDVWGDPTGDYARYYDPMLNLNKLSPAFQGKDVAIFISSTSGLAGDESLATTNDVAPGDVDEAINFVTVGGPIDFAANVCTHVLHQRLNARGIDHDARFYPQGTHNWNSFKWALPDSWPTLAPALGRPVEWLIPQSPLWGG
ncbi:hypothetical protein G7Y29_08580 [Corynebacterium qintianiae]|uniref:Esterase family protein n=1 Tax=Corynebacterium qintianiae TaxID=2709392 RepID=A0A7T0PFK0_9CORY|nr:alpha/beta hydrolase family protein [Corynebacterium qintianiae]QPK82907.1 hypothetical protein G7Y29_08580 [Corynebacterium qintianiae]